MIEKDFLKFTSKNSRNEFLELQLRVSTLYPGYTLEFQTPEDHGLKSNLHDNYSLVLNKATEAG